VRGLGHLTERMDLVPTWLAVSGAVLSSVDRALSELGPADSQPVSGLLDLAYLQ
jgi:hypothetical protein